MWFDGARQPNTIYVASVSRGKDSTAMLRAIQLMGWPLDMIAAVDIWATDDIPAELPPMVAFKDEWDAKCLEQFGMPVTRLCATRKICDSESAQERERERATPGTSTERASTEIQKSRIQSGTELWDSPSGKGHGAAVISKSPRYQKLTYEKLFYHVPKRRSKGVHVEREREREREQGDRADSPKSGGTGVQHSKPNLSANSIKGFPTQYKAKWCPDLKRDALRQIRQWARMGDTAQQMVSIASQGGCTRQSVFCAAPRARGEDKYRSLYRHCSRRAEAH